MKYLCSALLVLLLFSLWKNKSVQRELEQTKHSLIIALDVNSSNIVTIERLEADLKNTNLVLAKWDEDKADSVTLRRNTKKIFTEAAQNASFNDWATATVPAYTWSLLQQNSYSTDKKRELSPDSTNGSIGRLPRNASTKLRN